MRIVTEEQARAGMESARRWDAEQAIKAHHKRLGPMVRAAVREAVQDAILDAYWTKSVRGD